MPRLILQFDDTAQLVDWAEAARAENLLSADQGIARYPGTAADAGDYTATSDAADGDYLLDPRAV